MYVFLFSHRTEKAKCQNKKIAKKNRNARKEKQHVSSHVMHFATCIAMKTTNSRQKHEEIQRNEKLHEWSTGRSTSGSQLPNPIYLVCVFFNAHAQENALQKMFTILTHTRKKTRRPEKFKEDYLMFVHFQCIENKKHKKFF